MGLESKIGDPELLRVIGGIDRAKYYLDTHSLSTLLETDRHPLKTSLEYFDSFCRRFKRLFWAAGQLR